MSTPIAELFVSWRCKCGALSFRHHEHCDRCGEVRPAPPPEAEPSDLTRSEAMPSGYAIDPEKWAEMFLKSLKTCQGGP